MRLQKEGSKSSSITSGRVRVSMLQPCALSRNSEEDDFDNDHDVGR